MLTEKTVGFVLFENYHQRKNIGSSRIRGHYLIENMPEAECFVQGKEYGTVIYQKAYWKEHAREFQGKKILDICDPDWLDGAEVVTFAREMDAIIVPTEKMKETMSRFVEVPIHVIPDRILMRPEDKVKEHTDERAKTVAWFGYAHNMDVLTPAFPMLKRLGLTLKLITDGRFTTSECNVSTVKWDPLTWQDELLEADFCLIPDKLSGRGVFKSNNKTEQAWYLGLPVAKTPRDLERLVDPIERKREAEEKYGWVRKERAAMRSVEELRMIIESIRK